ncbi:2,4'-dihydroxyacetophenone dioxygenase family protein [Rhodococcus sp. NPDC060086]|uniref:2,4'-dihydroxyacetophenone dioxygenase family protein n=1 Tax=unclassified Rhodococcus (in: high G+C Gram-positive bacteria) TaxID=192944 RepID=UPI00364FC57F
MTAFAIPAALTRQTKDLPWTHGVLAPGLSMQLYVADVENGFFVVKTRFQPDTVIPTHMHTGAVHGFTESGKWFYREYGDDSVNVAGSYIYEPAGSTHTLEAPAENTEVTDAVFLIHGALINYGADGNVESVVDAAGARSLYFSLLEQQGDTLPQIIQGGNCTFTD